MRTQPDPCGGRVPVVGSGDHGGRVVQGPQARDGEPEQVVQGRLLEAERQGHDGYEPHGQGQDVVVVPVQARAPPRLGRAGPDVLGPGDVRGRRVPGPADVVLLGLEGAVAHREGFFKVWNINVCQLARASQMGGKLSLLWQRAFQCVSCTYVLTSLGGRVQPRLQQGLVAPNGRVLVDVRVHLGLPIQGEEAPQQRPRLGDDRVRHAVVRDVKEAAAAARVGDARGDRPPAARPRRRRAVDQVGEVDGRD